jgi:hypothetical protein
MKTENEPKKRWWLPCWWSRAAGRKTSAPAQPQREIERSILRKLTARMREEEYWLAHGAPTCSRFMGQLAVR